MAPNYLPAMLPASILSNTSRTTTTTTTIPHLLYALTTTSRRTTPTRPQHRNAASTSKTTRAASRRLPFLPPRSSPIPTNTSTNTNTSSSTSSTSTTTTTSRPLKPYFWAISLFGATTGLYLSYYISSLLLATSPDGTNPQTTSPTNDIDITTRWLDPTRDYDEEIEFSEKAMFMGRKRRRLLTENVVEGKVLEVSCGTGRNFEWYDFESEPNLNEAEQKGDGTGKERKKKRGIESLTFNDQSEIMLRKARAKWEGLQADRRRRSKGGTTGVFTGPVKGIVGDAGVRGVIPRPEGGFDTIVQTMGVCSMRDPVAFLREMRFLVRQPGERAGGTEGTDGTEHSEKVEGSGASQRTEGKGEAKEEEDRGGRILLLEHGRGHYDWINRLLDRGAVGHARRYGCWFNKDVGSVVAESGLVVERVRRYHLGTTWEVVLRPGRGEGEREEKGEEMKMVGQKESGKGGDGGGDNKADGKAWWRWW